MEDGLLRPEPTPQKEEVCSAQPFGKLEEMEPVEEEEESEPLLLWPGHLEAARAGACAAADGGRVPLSQNQFILSHLIYLNACSSASPCEEETGGLRGEEQESKWGGAGLTLSQGPHYDQFIIFKMKSHALNISIIGGLGFHHVFTGKNNAGNFWVTKTMSPLRYPCQKVQSGPPLPMGCVTLGNHLPGIVSSVSFSF